MVHTPRNTTSSARRIHPGGIIATAGLALGLAATPAPVSAVTLTEVDINPTGNSSPSWITEVAGRAVFRASDGTDTELYVLSFDTPWVSGLSGLWDTDGNWNEGRAPTHVDDAVIDASGAVTVTGPAVATTVYSLKVGAKDFGTATLALGDGVLKAHTANIEARGRLAGTGILVNDANTLTNAGTIDQRDGLSLFGGPVVNHGLILAGAGEFGAALDNRHDGQVRVAAGEHARFTDPAPQTNAGGIEVIGAAGQTTQLEFKGGLTNTDTGEIFAIGPATLRFTGGLNNAGQLSAAFGAFNLIGVIDNTETVGIGGDAVVALLGSLNQDGALNVLADSELVVFGDLTGAGGMAGGGLVEVLGTMSVSGSQTAVAFDGDLKLGGASTTTAQIGGTTPGTGHDRIDVTGQATLAGSLEIDLVNNFDTDIVPFDTFTLMTWGDNTGDTEFGTVNFTPPTTIPGISFDINYNEFDLAITADGLPGDANLDGTVDLTDLTILAINFGAVVNAGVVTSGHGADIATLAAAVGLQVSAVPEPATFAVLSVLMLPLRRRHTRLAA